MHYFLSELKRGIFSKKAFFCSILCLTSLLLGLYPYATNHLGEGSSFMFKNSYFDGISCTLGLLSPLFATIPFATSYIEEDETGFSNNMIIRIGKTKYISIKFIVNALSSSLILFFTTFVYYLILIKIYGVSFNDIVSLNYQVEPLFYNSQFAYLMLEISGIFFIGIIFSTMAMSFSALIKNKYIISLIPICWYLISASVFINLGGKFNSQIIMSLSMHPEVPIQTRIIHGSVLIITSLAIFFISSLYKERDLA